jgi:circadian clock protein KaiC
MEVCRNARSVGIDLEAWIAAGLLRFKEARPSLYGLEMHLARMNRDIGNFQPAVVAIDPISAVHGPSAEVRSILLRTIDLLKSRGITALFTSLRTDGSLCDDTDLGLSSLMDSWIKLIDVEENGERNRILYMVKSRGSSHSKQLREYRMTDAGIELIDAYIGPAGVLTGTARVIQEAHEEAVIEHHRQTIVQRDRDLTRRRESVERQIAELRAAVEGEEEEARVLLIEDGVRESTLRHDRKVIAIRRGAIS